MNKSMHTASFVYQNREISRAVKLDFLTVSVRSRNVNLFIVDGMYDKREHWKRVKIIRRALELGTSHDLTLIFKSTKSRICILNQREGK